MPSKIPERRYDIEWDEPGAGFIVDTDTRRTLVNISLDVEWAEPWHPVVDPAGLQALHDIIDTADYGRVARAEERFLAAEKVPVLCPVCETEFCVGGGPTREDGLRSDVPHWPHDGARLKDAVSDAIKRCAACGGRGIDTDRRPCPYCSPDRPDLDVLREEHCYITSVDGCCHCGDCECDGIGCIANLDPDDNSDYEAMENLHELLRQGQAWRVMRTLIQAGASLLDAYALSAGELARASNQAPPSGSSAPPG